MCHHPLITKWSSYRIDVHCLNDMVYVYYNLRLWVKQIDKVLDMDAIDTMSLWRVEIERPTMEEALEWLERDVDVLEELLSPKLYVMMKSLIHKVQSKGNLYEGHHSHLNNLSSTVLGWLYSNSRGVFPTRNTKTKQ